MKKALIRNSLFICLTILAITILKLGFSDPVSAACSGTDTFTLTLRDPRGAIVQNGSASINPVAGTDCDQADSDTVILYAYCQMPGNYTANVTCHGCASHSDVPNTTVLLCRSPERNQFIVQNKSGNTVAAIDSKGYLYLRGFNYSRQSNLNPPKNSYIIMNNTGKVVAFIDNKGNLNLTGNVYLKQTAGTPPKNSFVLVNKTNAVVGFIDSYGNLNLTGNLYFNWTDPI